MSRFLDAVFRPVYRVRYFATPLARERFEWTEEDFPEDFPAADVRAAELGRTLAWVSLISVGMADTDTHLAAYGTTVTHEAAPLLGDRRGKYHCECGAFLKDEAALARHHELAGWQPNPTLGGLT